MAEKKKRTQSTAKTTKATARKGKARSADAKPRRRAGKLVIVESPAKARSVGHFLGSGFAVKASKGHVRDLPEQRLSVDVKNDFEPTYRVLTDKREVVKELKEAVQSASEVYVATDPDREGEAIAWHLVAATGVESERMKRVVFHEITEDAVQHAFAHPRDINMDL